MLPRAPSSTLFPYTTLFRSFHFGFLSYALRLPILCRLLSRARGLWGNSATEDRKSTRLNSSHVKTSYAVFCLKQKTTQWTGVDHSSRASGALTLSRARNVVA